MKPYIKTATADTPSVILDAERGIFEISQMSLPEDAVDFYSPILAWLREYAQNRNGIQYETRILQHRFEQTIDTDSLDFARDERP